MARVSGALITFGGHQNMSLKKLKHGIERCESLAGVEVDVRVAADSESAAQVRCRV